MIGCALHALGNLVISAIFKIAIEHCLKHSSVSFEQWFRFIVSSESPQPWSTKPPFIIKHYVFLVKMKKRADLIKLPDQKRSACEVSWTCPFLWICCSSITKILMLHTASWFIALAAPSGSIRHKHRILCYFKGGSRWEEGELRYAKLWSEASRVPASERHQWKNFNVTKNLR